MGRRQEDQTAEIPDVFGVIGKIGVQFEIEVDIEIDGADNCEAIGVSFLVYHEQSRAIFLPLFLVDMDEHFSSGDE